MEKLYDNTDFINPIHPLIPAETVNELLGFIADDRKTPFLRIIVDNLGNTELLNIGLRLAMRYVRIIFNQINDTDFNQCKDTLIMLLRHYFNITVRSC